MRFPGFEGEWERKRIGSIGSFFSGGTPSSSKKEYYGGVIPFIRSGEIHSDKTELFLTEEGYDNSSAKMVEKGDILLALYGANSGDISISQIQGAINQAILCIRTDVAPVFFKSVWEKHVQRVLNTYLQGGQGNLSAEIVKGIPLFIPSPREQEKIAGLFSLIEERIAVQSKVIERYESLIRAIYNKIFGVASGMDIKLGDLVQIKKGTQLNGENLLTVGKYYVMNGGITPSGYYYSYNTPGEIISISEGGNSCGYVQYNSLPFWSGGHCYTLLLQPQYKDVAKYRYLYHYLKYHQDDIMAMRIGSGLPNIQKKDLERFQVILPETQIQERYTVLFDAIDSVISIEKALLNKLIESKKHLISQMFI